MITVRSVNRAKICFSYCKRYLFFVKKWEESIKFTKLAKYVSSSAAQWLIPDQNSLLLQTKTLVNLHSRQNTTHLHVSRTQYNDNGINKADNSGVLEELNGVGELGLYSENHAQEFEGLPSVKKKRSQKKNDNFIDEAARLAEIDAYLFCGNVDGAIEVFNRCRRKGHKFDISTFNKILHGLAAKKRVLDCQVFFHNMAGDNVKPDIQTYAAMLDLYGQFKDAKMIKEICAKMNSQGHNIKKIFKKSILTREQAKRILEAIRMVYPNYEAEICMDTRSTYISPLVQSLHEENKKNIEYNVPETLVREVMENFEQQLEQERVGFGTIKSVEKKKDVMKSSEDNHKGFDEIQTKWKQRLTSAIEREIELVKAGNTDNKRSKTGPFTRIMVPCEEYAALAVETITGPVCSQSYGAPLNYLCWLVGTQVYNRHAVKHKEKSGVVDKIRVMYEQFARLACDPEACKTMNPREMWLQLEKSTPYEGSIYCDITPWPTSIRVLVGCTLIDMLIRECETDANMFNHKKEKITPAFFHTYEYEHTTVSGYIKAHPSVIQLYQKHVSNCGDISQPASKLPMLIPSRPWTSITDGGHLVFSVQLARGQDKTAENLTALEEACQASKLNTIYDSLNCLGLCGWRVNGKILDLMIDIFNDKGNELLEIPGPDLPKIPEFKPELNDHPELYTAFLKEKTNAKKELHEAHALRMAMLYHLSVANHVRERTFWMPCNLDFRGRAYPIPPYGSHVGDDSTRGVLQFSRGKPLGPKGLDWLKVHLVNLHGKLKKASLKERIDYADKLLDEIHDSADYPLTGNRWWQTADEKWQVLATCMEISKAIRSGDPENFISHLPVQQDGSCNGLQHYAALGRDEYGGKQVNVLPSERPEDVYSEVARLVEKMCERDAANGVEIAQQLVGKVSRKVVKQTVMTLVYGVTFVGGRRQISGQLDDLGLAPSVVWKGSSYLTRNVFASIREMFHAAKDIQDWFTSAAAQIALSGHCVDWITPLNLPVMQSYHRMTKREVRTPLQHIKIRVPGREMLPNLEKQKGGFPPNFIHSLDSCHMMLTALHCQKHGLTFTSVHDSFWTHAADVDTMNKICREQFVSLHRQPILEDLRNHFVKKFGKKRMRRPLKNSTRDEVHFGPLPERGSLDLNEVLQSTYFFS
ncbi:DNA-directed RNA polymerase, mitochondrial-like [Dendronephthya gigantea]|uniref:DNA-directed RNA polymerase, mitochondrial-like n=1 Tax=Dendronephthya gigantea TaxID=151771 RepID=UPI00106CDD0E|nr:DNA-directed RNA polymerase, mitochondrial-like [Dendronephthya gigantea]